MVRGCIHRLLPELRGRFNLDGLSESEINYSKCVLAIITELSVISVLSINPSKRVVVVVAIYYST